MLSDEKILITGPAGQIAFPLASRLAADNEVWGIARFGNPRDRERVEAAGVTTRVCDIGAGDFTGVPDDVTVVLHLAATQLPGQDYDAALTVNAEGTGLLLAHCRKARAALVMSTQSVYHANEDPAHAYAETDPLGDSRPVHSPTYAIAKLGQEAVARTSARVLGLPVAIARMNASYGPGGGLPMLHLDAILAGRTVTTRWDPCVYSPIHDDDIAGQVGALVAAASVPATIVNWAGDERVSVQEWCAYLGEISGREARVEVVEVPGATRGAIADVTRRRALAGPCAVPWRDGMLRSAAARHPGAVPATVGTGARHSLDVVK
jgi:nucleoside-diphosphate-sugar epimerase